MPDTSEPIVFTRSTHVRWAEVDGNGHMKNTAYLDLAADTRMLFFAAHGFPMSEFRRRALGPVILRDEVDYAREAMLLDPLHVELRLGGLSADQSRFRLENLFLRPDGQRLARVVSVGGWLDLSARKLVSPPAEMTALMDRMAPTDDYHAINSRDRYRGRPASRE